MEQDFLLEILMLVGLYSPFLIILIVLMLFFMVVFLFFIILRLGSISSQLKDIRDSSARLENIENSISGIVSGMKRIFEKKSE